MSEKNETTQAELAAARAAEDAADAAREKRVHEAFIQRGLETVRQHTLDDKSIFAVARGIFHHILTDRPRLEDGDVPAETQVEEQVDAQGDKVVPQAGGDGGGA
jgi:hypothetical protein